MHRERAIGAQGLDANRSPVWRQGDSAESGRLRFLLYVRIPVQVRHQFQNQWGTIPGVGHLTEDRKTVLGIEHPRPRRLRETKRCCCPTPTESVPHFTGIRNMVSNLLMGRMMLIRLGYDIELEIAQSMAVVAVLNVHPSRLSDLREPDEIQVSPHCAHEQYRDSFGNICTRIIPCAICHRLPGRYRRPGRTTYGFQRMVRGLFGRQVVDFRRSQQPAADRPGSDGDWTRCR